MRINELINEAGLIGKLGSAVGKAAGAAQGAVSKIGSTVGKAGQAVGKTAGVAVGLGQEFKKGAEKWQGTGASLAPNQQGGNKAAAQKLPGDVDENELRDLLNAVLTGKQLNPEQQKVAQRMRNEV